MGPQPSRRAALLLPLALSAALSSCSVNLGSDDSGGSGDSGAPQAGAPSGSATAGISDPAWLGILQDGQHQEVSGSYTVASSDQVLNLTGELETLLVMGSQVSVAAESAESITIQGSDVVVYARSAQTIQVMGSRVTVRYLEGSPVVVDLGSDNSIEKLEQ
ncbi:DUF3060 domain-containing protein [Actinomyces bowdenii]|uniref:DUF3060 domain-containing protein n=1 Tax=Actinomyces bowdenii TaxID=131109 RepID=UPI001ABD3B84|nr:DUF3060 domain-containing protein [Actinomyces bowdenii]MBO3723527.1 DUF3060 domain-containing protein [Actinomyces bowdenii]